MVGVRCEHIQPFLILVLITPIFALCLQTVTKLQNYDRKLNAAVKIFNVQLKDLRSTLYKKMCIILFQESVLSSKPSEEFVSALYEGKDEGSLNFLERTNEEEDNLRRELGDLQSTFLQTSSELDKTRKLLSQQHQITQAANKQVHTTTWFCVNYVVTKCFSLQI